MYQQILEVTDNNLQSRIKTAGRFVLKMFHLMLAVDGECVLDDINDSCHESLVINRC